MKLLRNSACLLVFVLASLLPITGHADDGERWLNLRVQPIGVLTGEFMGDLDFAILNFLSIGVIGYSANTSISGATATGSGYGARADVLFSGRRFSNTWTLSAYGYYVPNVSMSIPLSGANYTGTFSMTEMGVLLGYDWVYRSGFTMSLALGPRVMNWPQPIVLTNGSSVFSTSIFPLSVKAEFTIGYAF